jgi:hypothetical protein
MTFNPVPRERLSGDDQMTQHRFSRRMALMNAPIILAADRRDNGPTIRRRVRFGPVVDELEDRLNLSLTFNLSILPAGFIGQPYTNAQSGPVQFSVTGGGTGDCTYSLSDTISNNRFRHAHSSSNSDFFTAFATAMTYQPAGFAKASVVSNSYGDNENNEPSGVIGLDSFFATTEADPMAFFFAMSDPGEDAFIQYNAANIGVVGIAQTYLKLDSSGNYGTEEAVDATGGSASVYELQPSWQNNVVNSVSTTMATTADVGFVGATNSAAAILDSFDNDDTGGWDNGNGSSLAMPSWAALMAIVNQGRALVDEAPLNGPTQTLQDLYSLAGTGDFNSVTKLNAGDIYDIQDNTVLSPSFANYNPWSGLGSPVANLLTLRAFFVENRPVAEIASRFGYKATALKVMISRFHAQYRGGSIPPFLSPTVEVDLPVNRDLKT